MTELNISFKALWKIVAVLALVVFLLAIRDLVVVVFFAIIISSAMKPNVDRLERWHIARTLGATIMYLLFLGGLSLLLWFILPPLAQELRDLIVSIRDDPFFFGGYTQPLTQFFKASEEVIRNLVANFSTQSGALFTGLANILGGIGAVVLTLVISFYLTVKDHGIKGFIDSLLPEKHRAPVLDLIERTQKTLARWLTGQLSLGLIVGVLVFIGLFILGNPFAMSLAVIAGIFELIPFIGPILSAVPGVLLAYSGSHEWSIALITALLYLVVQQFENHLIVPFVMRKAINVDPLLVLLIILVGGKIAGITGVVLAVPLAALFAEYIKGSTGVDLKLHRPKPK